VRNATVSNGAPPAGSARTPIRENEIAGYDIHSSERTRESRRKPAKYGAAREISRYGSLLMAPDPGAMFGKRVPKPRSIVEEETAAQVDTSSTET